MPQRHGHLGQAVGAAAAGAETQLLDLNPPSLPPWPVGHPPAIMLRATPSKMETPLHMAQVLPRTTNRGAAECPSSSSQCSLSFYADIHPLCMG